MLIVKLSYRFPDWLTDEQFEAMRRCWPGYAGEIKSNGVETKENDEGTGYLYKLKNWYRGSSGQRLHMEEAAELERVGIPLEIEGTDGTMLVRQKGSQIWRGEELPSHLVEGTVVQITIPDMALMLINEVTWMDDACTEDLQCKLDDGWRILAVCPPHSQRRPDYILGRKKP